MTPNTFCFTRNNHFLCIESNGLIHKLYLVFITKGFIIGIIVNKVLLNKDLLCNSSEGFVSTNMQEENSVLTNSKPYNCINDDYWSEVKNLNLFDESILEANKKNFRIDLSDITAFDYKIASQSSSRVSSYGLLLLSTHISDLEVFEPQKRLLYNASAKASRPNTKPIRKKLEVIKSQNINFDATYTAVRNWLLEQNTK